jgi:hypothetical protein
VKTVPGVQVEFNYTFNGEAVKTEAFDSHTASEVNPAFEKIGTMDTELVKFVERLNAALLAELDACYEEGMAAIAAGEMTAGEAFAAYKALVLDISKLMDASVEEEDAVSFDQKNYPALFARNPKLMADVGIFHSNDTPAHVRFLEYIRSAVSYEIVTKPQIQTPDGLADAMYSPYSNIEEAYVYYDSPYGIYYAWLKNYKYLPADKK